MVKGIDISHHQNDKGPIDWNKVKGAGYEFAFVKATQGTGYIDPFFKKNRDDARKAGLLVGFYHFAGNFQSSGASIPADPKAEADHFIKTVGKLEKNDIVILDWEVNHADPDTWCRTFLDRVQEKMGVKGLFYTYEAKLKATNFKKVLAGDYGLWIAKYSTLTPVIKPWTFYVLWQYSSEAKVNGITGSVDVNKGDVNLETLKKYGYQGGSTPDPEPEPVPVPTGFRADRYGHGKELFVKVGDVVKNGQKIGTIGDGNGQFPGAAHVHYDRFKKKPANWWDFPIGKTKEYTADNYEDPEPWKITVLPNFSHEGYGYLEDAQYPGGHAFHPGDDLNSGGGSSDMGDPFYAANDGVVVYAYAEGGSNHGWGKLLVIENTNQNNQDTMEISKEQDSMLEKLGLDFGNNLNTNELTRLLEKALQLQDGIKEAIRDLNEASGQITDLERRITDLEQAPVKVEPQELTTYPLKDLLGAIAKKFGGG